MKKKRCLPPETSIAGIFMVVPLSTVNLMIHQAEPLRDGKAEM